MICNNAHQSTVSRIGQTSSNWVMPIWSNKKMDAAAACSQQGQHGPQSKHDRGSRMLRAQRWSLGCSKAKICLRSKRFKAFRLAKIQVMWFAIMCHLGMFYTSHLWYLWWYGGWLTIGFTTLATQKQHEDASSSSATLFIASIRDREWFLQKGKLSLPCSTVKSNLVICCSSLLIKWLTYTEFLVFSHTSDSDLCPGMLAHIAAKYHLSIGEAQQNQSIILLLPQWCTNATCHRASSSPF